MVEIHRIKIHFYKKGCKKFLQPNLKFYKFLISTWNFIIAKLGQILFHFMAWVCFRNFANDKWRDEIWIQNQFGPKCCGVTLLHFMARVCFRNFADDEWWDEICTGSWKRSQCPFPNLGLFHLHSRYCRVHISSVEVFSKILKKPSIVQI